MISTQFWIRFWIHSNKFLDKVFAKALFLKSFLVCNFWKIWFWFFLTNQCVEHILSCYQAYLWSSKRCRTKFWAVNYDLKTFLKSSKPFVLFISDMSLCVRNNNSAAAFLKRFSEGTSSTLYTWTMPCILTWHTALI